MATYEARGVVQVMARRGPFKPTVGLIAASDTATPNRTTIGEPGAVHGGRASVEAG